MGTEIVDTSSGDIAETLEGVAVIAQKENALLLVSEYDTPLAFRPPAQIDVYRTIDEAATQALHYEAGTFPTYLQYEGDIQMEVSALQENTPQRWHIYYAETKNLLHSRPTNTQRATWLPSERLQELAQHTRQYLHGHIPEEKWGTTPALAPEWWSIFKELGLIS